MNVRKPVDYGTMYRELTAILTQNLSQMDEVYAIGKAISQRPEKGAAVAAAEFLQANFPDRAVKTPLQSEPAWVGHSGAFLIFSVFSVRLRLAWRKASWT